MNHVQVWTDGACTKSGFGGWAALVLSRGSERVLSGRAAGTTSNRMELTAVIRALQFLPSPTNVTMFVDSAYVLNPVTKGWLKRWVRDGWLGAWYGGERKMVMNRDLWEEFLVARGSHRLALVKVKGHSGVELNERADGLACEQRDLAVSEFRA